MTWQEGIGAAAREMRLGGVIVLGSGSEVTFDGDYVTAMTLREGADGAIEPGDVLSAEITLDVVHDALGGEDLIGATLMPRLELICGGETLCQNLGVFVIESATYLEQQGLLRIKGADAVASELADSFTDTAAAYPMTLQRLWQRVLAQTRFSHSGDVPNGSAIIDALPEWDGATLRSALGCVAAAAGCFVRIGREGEMQLVPLWREDVRTLTADSYYILQADSASYGPVDALRVRFRVDGEEVRQTWCTGESAVHCVNVTGNPLFQYGAAHLDSLARGLLSQIAGYQSGAAAFEWQGDPLLCVGDRVEIADAHGGSFSGVLSRQTLTFSGGLRAECRCTIPDAADSGVRRAITPEGRLNAAALTGALNGAILSAGSVSTDKLAAGSVTAEKLAAGSVDASRIKAYTITSDRIAANTITGNNIASETITALNIAGKTITADRLISNIITADCGLIADSAIQTAQIADGSITAAKIVSLNADVITAGTLKAERLLIAGEDGVIYQINAAASGLSKTELEKDKYSQYLNGTVIVAQSITAAQLAAATITGNEIAANAIKAGNIDVASLFADTTFTNRLYTSEIYGGKSIKIMADETAAKLHYMEVRPDGTHLKAMGTTNEMVLTNEGLHVDVNGETYSRFAAKYVQFGNYQLRRTEDGGLAFKLKVATDKLDEAAFAALDARMLGSIDNLTFKTEI